LLPKGLTLQEIAWYRERENCDAFRMDGRRYGCFARTGSETPSQDPVRRPSVVCEQCFGVGL